MARYFYGEGSDLGTCKATTARNFRELVERYLSVPVLINRTHDEFLSLTKRERDQLKKTNYLVPCTFTSSPSPRQHQFAKVCNLLCHGQRPRQGRPWMRRHLRFQRRLSAS